MLKALLSGQWIVAALLVSAACTPKDSTYLDQSPSGGAGGTPGSAGSGNAGQPAGAAGAAGVGSGGVGGAGDAGMPDAGLARFGATLEGQTVSLIALDPVWVQDCDRNPRLMEQVAGSWVLPRDDRPDAFNLNFAAHYLDGVYHSDCRLTLGCDVAACEALEHVDAWHAAEAAIALRYLLGESTI